MSTVMVVDDKVMMRDSVGATLQRAGFTVVTADGGEAALAQIAQRRPDAVVTDQKMPGMSGLELLERVRAIDDDLPVVVMTAYGEVDAAVKAMKLGAFDYMTKPFEGDEVIIAVKRAIEMGSVRRENAVLKLAGSTWRPSGAGADGETAGRPGTPGSPDERRGLDRLIGASPAMHRVRQQVLAVAESQGTVLIFGESGSGKEVVARAVHEVSLRAAFPFLAVNCAALSEALLESELFGHERGAFTGAERLRKGRFELADGGTLLLDEVSEVGPQIQAKLLRVLQERAFERVGSSLTMGVDVRVIATSNRDLPRAVSAGEFRQDLFFRLNVLPIHVPPLRDRLEDVPALAEHLLSQTCRREGRGAVSFEPEALELLSHYTWPGNVRELQNICERAVVLSGSARRSAEGGAGPEGLMIRREMIEPWLLPGGGPGPAQRAMTSAVMEAKPMPNGNGVFHAGETLHTLEQIEREAIIAALHRFSGHRVKTARALGIGVRTLGLKLKKWKQLQLVEQGL